MVPRKAKAAAWLDCQFVREVERRHDAAHAVEAVLAPRENFQREIDFRRSSQDGHRESSVCHGARRRLCARCRSRFLEDMGSSYDAQRNEFCAYVLHESETPYGLL